MNVQELKSLPAKELARLANKTRERASRINQHTLHFDEGPLAGYDWNYSVGHNVYQQKVALTLPFTINGVTGYYELRTVAPFESSVVFVTMKDGGVK